MVFLLWASRKTKAALVSGLLGLAFLASWFVYGAYYNWPLFIHLQGVFSGRELRLPTMIIGFFDTFRISEKMMSTDGLLIWGWISLVILPFLKEKNHPALSMEPIL